MGRRQDITVFADDHTAPHGRADLDADGALDRMLGQTFGQLLGTLPVPERVAQALVQGEGPYQPYLELAIAVEMESPIDIREHTESMLLSPSEVNRAALKAMGTARQLRAD